MEVRFYSSWHPVQKLPMDGIYFLVLKFTVVSFPKDNQRSHNITMDVQWRGPYGYLSAIDYPLLRFYAFMCVFYMILALVWLAVCLKHWKDILRIQFWIGELIFFYQFGFVFFSSFLDDCGKLR